MGRPKVLGRCKKRGCAEIATRRELCAPHYFEWYAKNKHLRCQWDGCRAFQADGGRRMKHGNRVLFYCREHEVEHLRWSADVQELNLRRLGESLSAEGDCWVWQGKENVADRYPLFMPEGANNVYWVAYRVLWNLTLGGHEPRHELDHCMCGNPRCCSPAHLEPVSRSENERRKRKPSRRVNWEAVENPAVIAFAERFALPLPSRH